MAYAKSWEFSWEDNEEKAADLIEIELSWRSETVERPRMATKEEEGILEDFAYDLDEHDSNDMIQLTEDE